MKLDQFKALCDREWTQEPRGDVQALHLTDESLREFTTEALLAGGSEPWLTPLVLNIREEDLPAIHCGAKMTDILNPITRSPVSVDGGSDQDMAEVYSRQGPKAVPVA